MRLQITDTVKHLLIINVLMFVGTMTIGNGELFYKWFSLYFPKNELFQPWQIITHMFMHGGASLSNLSITHILFNMFALWMFGTAVEQALGSKKFLFIYISAGLGAVFLTFLVYYIQIFQDLNTISNLGLSNEVVKEILHTNILNGRIFDGDILSSRIASVFNKNGISLSIMDSESLTAFYNVIYRSFTPMVGASGCIMGVLAAFGMMNPEAKLMMIFLPIPIKAKYFIPGIIILDIISAVSGQSFFSPSNTAYLGHVGGALTGFLIMWYWKKNQFNKHRWN